MKITTIFQILLVLGGITELLPMNDRVKKIDSNHAKSEHVIVKMPDLEDDPVLVGSLVICGVDTQDEKESGSRTVPETVLERVSEKTGANASHVRVTPATDFKGDFPGISSSSISLQKVSEPSVLMTVAAYLLTFFSRDRTGSESGGYCKLK